MPTKAHFVTAGVALLAFAAIAFVQRKFVTVPVVGEYLPK